jgi:hypothetical protein
MTKLVGIQEEIIDALKTAQQAQTVNIEMDGGGFSKVLVVKILVNTVTRNEQTKAHSAVINQQ